MAPRRLEPHEAALDRSDLDESATELVGFETKFDRLEVLLEEVLDGWKIKSPRTDCGDYVVCTHDGGHVAERNLRRALDAAKTEAKLDEGEKRPSWHSLRHSAGSIWLTEYGLPVTTVSAMMGHSNPAFTLACYGRDPRDEQAVVTDVLARAAAATHRDREASSVRTGAGELALRSEPN